MGFDVIADEPPLHTLTVALAAAIVGVGRFRLRRPGGGRMAGVVAAVNLSVLAQPAVHALSKLSHLGGDALPHSHGAPENLSGIALHLVVALLVVAVAANEPACAFVASWVLRAVTQLRALLLRDPAPVGPSCAVRRHVDRIPVPHRQLSTGQPLTRRGPPARLGLAG